MSNLSTDTQLTDFLIKEYSNFHTMDVYTCRIKYSLWNKILLAGYDRPIIRGNNRQIIAKNLGYGVLELSLAPLKHLGKDEKIHEERKDS